MTQAALLSTRGVLKVSGKDRASFLQGLITNDVNKIGSDNPIYAALLSPQGKFQYDLFVVAGQNPEGEEVWYIDCNFDRAEMLLKRLSLYKLRSDVTIDNVSDQMAVGVCWSDTALTPTRWEGSLSIDEGYAYEDPRLAVLGVRFIINRDHIRALLESKGYIITSEEDYDYHRLKSGVPDGERDGLIDRGILLECGFDELNAIDWQKGCYLGQELTARTRYRGLIRKRLIPIHIDGETPAYQSPIYQDGVEVGELRSTRQDWGMAMIRLEALSKTLPFLCGGATLTPHVPNWMCLPSSQGDE